MADVPALFVHWEGFVRWLLPHTSRFPRHWRPSLTTRIENLALDVLGWTSEARYDVDREGALVRINLALEKLRILLRLCHDLTFFDTRSFTFAAERVDTAGRMTGGWLRSLRSPT